MSLGRDEAMPNPAQGRPGRSAETQPSFIGFSNHLIAAAAKP
jgi:hypothetical protein